MALLARNHKISDHISDDKPFQMINLSVVEPTIAQLEVFFSSCYL